MKISISERNDVAFGFKPIEVNSIADIARLVTNNRWSCGVFKNGHRNLKNFISADSLALDIDNVDTDVTIEEASADFAEYKHLILPTKSHRKLKNGKVADRFRVLLPFENTVTDPNEIYGTWFEMYKKFPYIDQQCKDPSRFWEPSTSLFKSAWEGKSLSAVKIERNKVAKTVLKGLKGTLLSKTLNFLLTGAQDGSWNITLHSAALDLRSQGYEIEEAFDLLSIPCRESLGNNGELDHSDLATIKSAFQSEVYHDKRGAANSFQFETVGNILKNQIPVNWLVEGLLTVGGMSIIAGAPKSGKSTIIRQLGKCVSSGGDFLNRKVQKGSVLYLALEEQRDMLAEQLKRLGVNDNDPFYVHTGPVLSSNKNDDLTSIVQQFKPSLVVIDTMILFAGADDINSYNEMYKILSFFRNLARENQTHITFVHHQNKSMYGGTKSIMGSSAIHGSVDNAIIFNTVDDVRFISTSQRGGRPFSNTELEFDPDTESYHVRILGVF